jgi:hypothetical protein
VNNVMSPIFNSKIVFGQYFGFFWFWFGQAVGGLVPS